MPLMTGAIFLFAEIFTFALPVAMVIAFATIFYRQGRRVTETGSAAGGTVTAADGGGARGAVGASGAGGAGGADAGGAGGAGGAGAGGGGAGAGGAGAGGAGGATTTSGERFAAPGDPYSGSPHAGS